MGAHRTSESEMLRLLQLTSKFRIAFEELRKDTGERPPALADVWAKAQEKRPPGLGTLPILTPRPADQALKKALEIERRRARRDQMAEAARTRASEKEKRREERKRKGYSFPSLRGTVEGADESQRLRDGRQRSGSSPLPPPFTLYGGRSFNANARGSEQERIARQASVRALLREKQRSLACGRADRDSDSASELKGSACSDSEEQRQGQGHRIAERVTEWVRVYQGR